MKKEYLLAPGPTPVPPDVLLEMARPMFHHRTSGFRKMLASVVDKLKKTLLTSGDVLTLAGSGTAAMEAALSNTTSPGGKALIVQGGKFGERWTELAKAFGVNAKTIETEWGAAVDPAQIEAELKKNPDIQGVFITYCETSTAVRTNVEAIGKIVARTDAVLVVDGISAVPAMEMRTDDWHVDMLVIGSQKALMLAPGLALVTVSEKAWAKIEKFARGYYLNLARYRKSAESMDPPYTPAVNLLTALNRSLGAILETGLENVWSETALMARATREAAEAMGLKTFARDPADAVTALALPEGVDGIKVTREITARYGITIAGGQAQLKGKIVRIGHMGYVDRFEVLAALAALEDVLGKMGAPINKGVALAKAWEVFTREQ